MDFDTWCHWREWATAEISLSRTAICHHNQLSQISALGQNFTNKNFIINRAVAGRFDEEEMGTGLEGRVKPENAEEMELLQWTAVNK